MKCSHSIFYILVLFMIFGCTETTFIDDPAQQDEVIVHHHHTTTTSNTNYSTTYQTPTTSYTTTTSQGDLVQLKYQVQTDYPSGRARDIQVWNNNQLLTESALIAPGTYNFRIQKAGYQSLNKNVQVTRDYEGQFALTGMLRAKERLVIFRFVDARTNKPIVADKVSIAEIGGGSETQIISDQSYVKPGRKIVVIEKVGYNTHSQEFDLPPGETSFTLNASIMPSY